MSELCQSNSNRTIALKFTNLTFLVHFFKELKLRNNIFSEITDSIVNKLSFQHVTKKNTRILSCVQEERFDSEELIIPTRFYDDRFDFVNLEIF